MSRPRTDDPHHRKLESDVEGWLRAHGFNVRSNAYHDTQDEEFVRLLQRTDDMTALAVRTLSDRIAAHDDPKLGATFRVEFKTITGRHDNLAVEALPLAHHRKNVALGCRCLYVVRDPTPGEREYEGGWWVNGDPLPGATLFIPDRFRNQLEGYLTAAFPECNVAFPEYVGGSGDPFIRIPRNRFGDLMTRDWRGLVLELLPAPTIVF